MCVMRGARASYRGAAKKASSREIGRRGGGARVAALAALVSERAMASQERQDSVGGPAIVTTLRHAGALLDPFIAQMKLAAFHQG